MRFCAKAIDERLYRFYSVLSRKSIFRALRWGGASMIGHGGPGKFNYLKFAGAVVLNEILGWLIFTRTSHFNFTYSYVDPGSGLLIWQLLAATAFGVVFNVRNRISRLFKRGRFSEKE